MTSYEQFPDELPPAVVIDNGTGLMKVGFSGTEQPSHMFPTMIGEPKHKMVMVQKTAQQRYVGKSALDSRGILKLSYPMKHGVIADTKWDEMQSLWENAYDCIKSPANEHPVLLTEAPLNPTRNRSKMASIFFDNFDVPALFVAPQAVLSLYASGRLTGAVLDSGHGVTHCVPVYEGFALPHAITRMDLAGADVTNYLNLLLKKSDINFHTSAEMETVRAIKEEKCETSLTRNLKHIDDENILIGFTLPDGQRINIGQARFRAPEILFDPSLVGKEYRGIQFCVLDSIAKSDLDLRRALYSSIILSGGSTCFKNFGQRLLNELNAEAPQSAKIRIYAPKDRMMSTWVGGSILSSLHNFKNLWITKREFREAGVNVLFRKTF